MAENRPMTTAGMGPDSTQRLVNELRQRGEVPVVLRGDTGSGCSSVARAAGERLGLDLIECEAGQLIVSPPVDMLGAPSMGMHSQMDAMVALAALRDGEEPGPLVVIDHLDMQHLDDPETLLDALAWMARRVRVVAITGDNLDFDLPETWPVVEHTAVDVARYWSGPPRPTVVHSVDI